MNNELNFLKELSRLNNQGGTEPSLEDIKEFEQWLGQSFRWGVNPLPRLRKIVGESHRIVILCAAKAVAYDDFDEDGAIKVAPIEFDVPTYGTLRIW